MSEQKQSGNGKPDHLLALRGFTKSVGQVQALVDVDFEVHAGEVVALVGDNGAGKSTLIKAIDGVQPADTGRRTSRQRVHISGREAARRGIATVFQDLALCDNLDVVANLFLGQEVAGNGGVPLPTLNETEMEQRSLGLLKDLAVTSLGSGVRTEVGSLSGGQRQSVAIARSLVGEPKILLFVTSQRRRSASPRPSRCSSSRKRLADRGLGVVVISHNLANVFAVADRIVVLRLGKRVATFEGWAKSSREEVVASITGASADGEMMRRWRVMESATETDSDSRGEDGERAVRSPGSDRARRARLRSRARRRSR